MWLKQTGPNVGARRCLRVDFALWLPSRRPVELRTHPRMHIFATGEFADPQSLPPRLTTSTPAPPPALHRTSRPSPTSSSLVNIYNHAHRDQDERVQS